MSIKTAAAWLFTLTALLGLQAGCGATCDRIGEDRDEFLARKPKNAEPHLEAIVPFGLAEKLVAPQIAKVKPIEMKLPGLGRLGSYFDELQVVPAKVELRPAADDHVGFRLSFDIRDKGRRAFSMYADIEVEPEIDLEQGKIIVAFTPETLERVTPKLSKGAKQDLGGLIYKRLPRAARIFIPRSLVDSAAGGAVKTLINSFYKKAKPKLLPKLAKLSRFELELPDLPLEAVRITSPAEASGALRIVIVTSLPVRAGLVPPPEPVPFPKDRISLRLSGSTLAELVNWAMASGLVPARYDSKGKPKEQGELRPGLDWVPGKRPMKVYLWDLEKPCMRITMAAKPSVEVVDDQLQIKALDTKTEDVEASAFTKVGVWFYILWKDAIKLKKKAKSQLKFKIADEELVARVEDAAVDKHELRLAVSLVSAPPPPKE